MAGYSIFTYKLSKMKSPEPWHIMATHTICFRGEEGKVEVVQTTNRIPQFFFFVHFPTKDILLSRFGPRPELWNGSGFLSLEEAKELAESIEQQIGYNLPPAGCNDPFEYRGDIKITIEIFKIGELRIKRAKAPFTNDVYYQIIFSKNRKVTMVKMERLFDEEEGTFTTSDNLAIEDFEVLKSMLISFEKAYQLGIYTAIQAS